MALYQQYLDFKYQICNFAENIYGMARFNELSAPQIIKELGSRFKSYRLEMDLTQKELSNKTGVSVQTIRRFESGTATSLNFDNFIELLRAAGLINNLDETLPEIPVSAAIMAALDSKKKQRVRHH